MTIVIWIGFILLIAFLLFLDLGLLHKKNKVMQAKGAILWTFFWIALSLLFNLLIYYMYEHHWLGIGSEIGHQLSGKQAALQYFTGYLLEKSLSMDNIFVIAMIFSYFKVPAEYQHRVLFWGIAGAIVLRGALIFAGSALITKFTWMNYVFGAFLVITAIKMLVIRHDSVEPDKNPLVRIMRKIYPVSKNFDHDHFFTRENNTKAITPLFLVLIVIESTDVMFALDSIPAIFAVSHDPFIIFTSNIFAILGLRSLYFALAAMMSKFRYLKMSLVFVLAFVGAKMILTHYYPIKTVASLVIILIILAVGLIASLYAGNRDTAKLKSPIE